MGERLLSLSTSAATFFEVSSTHSCFLAANCQFLAKQIARPRLAALGLATIAVCGMSLAIYFAQMGLWIHTMERWEYLKTVYGAEFDQYSHIDQNITSLFTFSAACGEFDPAMRAFPSLWPAVRATWVWWISLGIAAIMSAVLFARMRTAILNSRSTVANAG